MPDPSGGFRTHAAYLEALTRVCGFGLFGSDANAMRALAAAFRASQTYTNQNVVPEPGPRQNLALALDAFAQAALEASYPRREGAQVIRA